MRGCHCLEPLQRTTFAQGASRFGTNREALFSLAAARHIMPAMQSDQTPQETGWGAIFIALGPAGLLGVLWAILPAVLGIALLVSYAAVGLRDAPVRLLLAHVLITFPFSVRTILASLSRLDPSLEEAAATLGAKPVTIFWRVTFPLIQPGIAAGAIFSFVMSFDNIPVSIFLTDVHTNTIPIAIMSYLEYNFDPSIAAVSSMLIVGSLALGLFLERIFGLRRAMGM